MQNLLRFNYLFTKHSKVYNFFGHRTKFLLPQPFSHESPCLRVYQPDNLEKNKHKRIFMLIFP